MTQKASKTQQTGSDMSAQEYSDKLLNLAKKTPAANQTSISEQVEPISLDKLKVTVMFLTTKYALTKNEVYAQAAYQHLCMLNDRCGSDPELQFLSKSLAMDWYAIGHKVALDNRSNH